MWCLLLTLGANASAFEVLVNDAGRSMSWAAMPIEWEINTDGAPGGLASSEQIAAVRAAFDAWNDVPDAGIAFEAAGTTHIHGSDDDRHNVVYWERNWDWDPDILALTSTWSLANGKLVGFDIRINAETTDWSYDGMDLQNAMTHEVGHAVGLDHTPTHSAATMFGSTRPGELIKRDLHWDDEDGARFLYPDGAHPLFACSTGGSPTGSTLALSLAFALALGRRKEDRCAR